MNGYGFSIWVLINHKNILELKNQTRTIFNHVLHITLATNLETREEAEKVLKKFPKKVDYEIEGVLEFSSKMYKHDPLNALIFPTKLLNTKTDFPPHVSIRYVYNNIKQEKILIQKIKGSGLVVIADTRSYFPEKWRFFK